MGHNKPEAINHAELVKLSNTHNLRQEMIYHLIEKRLVSPSLKLATDLAVLKVLGNCQRDRNFARLILARFSIEERREMFEHPGMGHREFQIKKALTQAKEARKTITTLNLCKAIYAMEGLEYSPNQPDEALLNAIARIRRSLCNKTNYVSRRVGSPAQHPPAKHQPAGVVSPTGKTDRRPDEFQATL